MVTRPKGGTFWIQNFMGQNVYSSTLPKSTSSHSLQRQCLVSSGVHINLHSLFTFGSSAKDYSLDFNYFLQYIFYSLALDAFQKLMELLKDKLRNV